MLTFIMWIRKERAEHLRRIQDAKKRLLYYGVSPNHVDFLARHCANTSPSNSFSSRPKFSKKYPHSAITFIIFYPLLAVVGPIGELNPEAMGRIYTLYAIIFALFLIQASRADNRRPSSALIRMLLNVCEIESLLAFLQEENPLNRHEPKKIARGVPILLKIDIVDEHHLYRKELIKHARRLALDTHVIAGYARKYDDERWSRSAQVFLWVSESLFSATRAKIGQDHCGVLLAHITKNKFLEPVPVGAKYKPITDLLATPRANVTRFVSFPLVVTLIGALIASGTTIVVSALFRM